MSSLPLLVHKLTGGHDSVQSNPRKLLRSIPKPILAIGLVNTLTLIVTSTQIKGYADDLWVLVFAATLFAHCALLGLTAGLGESVFWQRWLLAAAGTLATAPVCVCISYSERDGFLIVALAIVTTLVVGLASSFLRLRGALIRRLPPGESPGQLRQFRFYLRDLFGVTVAVAVLVKTGQSLDPDQDFGIVFIFGLVLSVAGIAGAWAALGPRPYLRCPAALVLAAAVGALGGICQGHTEFMFWSMCDALQAALVMMALFWLRRYGYRLTMRESTATAELAPERSTSDAIAIDQTSVP